MHTIEQHRIWCSGRVDSDMCRKTPLPTRVSPLHQSAVKELPASLMYLFVQKHHMCVRKSIHWDLNYMIHHKCLWGEGKRGCFFEMPHLVAGPFISTPFSYLLLSVISTTHFHMQFLSTQRSCELYKKEFKFWVYNSQVQCNQIDCIIYIQHVGHCTPVTE